MIVHCPPKIPYSGFSPVRFTEACHQKEFDGADAIRDDRQRDYTTGVDQLVDGRDINAVYCPLADGDALTASGSEGRSKFSVYGEAPHSKISFRRSS